MSTRNPLERGSTIEALDVRRLMTVAASIDISANGTVVVIGDSNDNSITVGVKGNDVIARCDGLSNLFPRASVSGIAINGFSGNDTIHNETGIPSSLAGGSGFDSIVGGSANDLLDGWNPLVGDDDSDGPDTLEGGLGNDEFLSVGDVIDYTRRDVGIRYFGTYDNPTPLDFTVRVGNDEVDRVYGNQTFWGTRFADEFIPGDVPGPFFYLGFAGDDYFQPSEVGGGIADGGEGDDTIILSTTPT